MMPDQIAIPEAEIQFHPLSYADPSGRVFWWRGELYRGIAAQRADFYRRLFETGLIARLQEQGLLIGTEWAKNLSVPGFAMVLKHRKVPFVSYPFEWSGQMLKAAALKLLDLEIELARHGLTHKDAHALNVLFDGSEPVPVDFGSISSLPPDGRWPGFREFCDNFIYPLILMNKGCGRIVRSLQHDPDRGLSREDLLALSPSSYLKFKMALAARKVFTPTKATLAETIISHDAENQPIQLDRSKMLQGIRFRQQLRELVRGLKLPSPKTNWSGYYKDEFPSFTPSAEWSPKHRTVYDCLTRLKPATVIDAGSNRGWHAQLAARLGSEVVAFDLDEPSLGQLYLDARSAHLRILPLMMNFQQPSPRYGLGGQFQSAEERLGCDLVMALALVHHLVFKGCLRFEQIVEGLSIFSKRWLLVEFIPPEERHVSQWMTKDHDWYSLANFETALKRSYRTITRLPSFPEPRLLLLCEK